MKTPANKTVWLGTAEIAQRYGLDQMTVRNWIRVGVQTGQGVVRLRGLQVGRRWLIRKRWLKEFMQSIENAQAAQGLEPPPQPAEPADKQKERFAEEKRRLQERLSGRKAKGS